MSAFAGSRDNDLEELASRARVHSRLNPRKQDSSRVATKGASIYKDYSRVVKVEPTVATRKETPARLRREEPVVTAVNRSDSACMEADERQPSGLNHCAGEPSPLST